MDKAVEVVEKSHSNDPLEGGGRASAPRLGIFAKEPVPGEVKTRLCPPLNVVQAARLYRAALEETVARMRPFSPVIFYAGGGGYFRDAFAGIPLYPQGEGDLGERMCRALRFLLASGAPGAALIGSDSPDLQPAIVAEALKALRESEVVTVPSLDGGYVLIGERRHHRQLFRDIPWSTEKVLTCTRERCRKEGIAYREVGEWEDLDDLASLKRLLLRSPDSATAACARTILDNLSAA